jgi:hypothetical protein
MNSFILLFPCHSSTIYFLKNLLIWKLHVYIVLWLMCWNIHIYQGMFEYSFNMATSWDMSKHIQSTLVEHVKKYSLGYSMKYSSMLSVHVHQITFLFHMKEFLIEIFCNLLLKIHIVASIYHINFFHCWIKMKIWKCVNFAFFLEKLSKFQIIPKYANYFRF